MRVGQGFDVHSLVVGRPLILGGVTIPYEKGLQGHSDADALLHALTDALLGGAGLGDIGRHFPDTDPRFEGADSRLLLRTAYSLVRKAGWVVGNIDATLHAQAPKMAAYVADMIQHISDDLQIGADQVNIKAKTNEGLGYLGRKEGIAANVSVLLFRS
ncbi:MAG TPA: 2-C-methyl-D-erythritol 2,4-cyclodiphosphate synthase [Pusillimonas sp.]|nr:2-C-methyl-D-erythritol 2,4-cyclodiphosphate synthase [Pusillimonas sp.]